jgi:hypothetical protein
MTKIAFWSSAGVRSYAKVQLFNLSPDTYRSNEVLPSTTIEIVGS